MSLSELIPFVLAVVVILLILIRWVRRIRLVVSEQAWRPPELKHADLVYMERVFRTRWPIRLVARVDRGYRGPDGVITLVEFKTRHADRVYLSDVIELSAQRLAVQTQTGQRVSAHGYVLVKRTEAGKQIPHRVKLLRTLEVTGLARRREAILAGETLPRCTPVEGLCIKCPFEHECPRA